MILLFQRYQKAVISYSASDCFLRSDIAISLDHHPQCKVPYVCALVRCSIQYH